VINPVDILGDPAVRAALKAQIAELDKAQAAGDMPATVEEANQLEQQLTGALEELRAHRTQLQKSGEAGGTAGQAPGGAQGQTGGYGSGGSHG
jgi:hypothetical protein